MHVFLSFGVWGQTQKKRFEQQKQKQKKKTKRRKNFPKPKKAQKKLSTLFPRGSCSNFLHCEVARALKKEETFSD